MPDGNNHHAQIVGIIPMKPTSQAKSRLASVLEPEQRATLSLEMLARVVRAAVESELSSVVVLGGDSRVRAKADRWNADWRPDQGRGLNGELTELVKENSALGAASAYIPGDVVLLTSAEVDLSIKASEFGTLLTMCPAAIDGGTNGLVIPARSPFELRLGEDSFNKHKLTAAGLGLPYAVLEARGFGLDLDTPEDLAELQRLEPGLLEMMIQSGVENQY